HVWAMSTTENAMTAHIVIEDSSGKGQIENIKNNLKHALQNMNIQHITLETEFSSNPCEKIED
ncbi:MAG: cation transporter, partial [Ginsengibacter sp.]